jgi:hypothetical protein
MSRDLARVLRVPLRATQPFPRKVTTDRPLIAKRRPEVGRSLGRWNNSPVERVRFRYNISISLAAALAFLGAIPVATVGFGHGPVPVYAYFLLLILLVPLAVAIWGWRAGTDANADGLRVRALVASRRIPWAEVATLATNGRRVYVRTTDGKTIRLAAVTSTDLPRLIAASGQKITRETSAAVEQSGAAEQSGTAEQSGPVPAGRHRRDDAAAADARTGDARSVDSQPVADQ